MKRMILSLLLLAALVFCLTPSMALAAEKYKVAWSHYIGWEPWEYARHTGILDKWAKKYGIEIELSEPMDYIESINLYTSGEFDACVMTNMDALTIPAVGGVDSTALIVGDFSNGNDGIVMKNGASVADLKGREIKLVELSVSHYLLARALEMNGMSEQDVQLVNTSDSDIPSLFSEDPNAAVVTWNPLLMQVRNMKGATMVFDSSKIPGEIIDLMVVKTDAPDTLKKALTGAWYEVLGVMFGKDAAAKEAIAYMAEFTGATVPEFHAQLKTTKMFVMPQDAAAFAQGAPVKQTMEYVRTFSFDHGLYGQGAADKDLVGIAFPDGSVIGDANNIKFRFDDTYMKMAAEGGL